MPNSTPDQKTDHRAEAGRWLRPTKDPQPGQRDREIAIALVHSNLAIAEELKGIRMELEEGAIEVVYGGATVRMGSGWS